MKIRILTAIVMAFAFQHITISSLGAATFYVDPEDMPAGIQAPYVFPGIQVAVDAADPGDTVVVPNGTYTENVVIDKALTVQSLNGPDVTTVIASDPSSNVFTIDAENVTLSGFTVYGAGDNRAGIWLSARSGRCTISNNNCGVSIENKNGNGISLYITEGNIISQNNCSYNTHFGIRAFRSDDSTFIDNTCNYNDTGILIGTSETILLEENNASSNSGEGIYIQHSNNSVLRRNNSYGNSTGITLDGGTEDPITGNLLINNYCYNNSYNNIYISRGENNYLVQNKVQKGEKYGIYSYLSTGNYLWLNNLLSSAERHIEPGNATDNWMSPTLLWYTYDGKTVTSFLGNFYDDHQLHDNDGDGVTEKPYTHSSPWVTPGEESSDWYPLVRPSYQIQWNWNVVSSGNESISFGASRTVGTRLTILDGSVAVEGGVLTIGSLW